MYSLCSYDLPMHACLQICNCCPYANDVNGKTKMEVADIMRMCVSCRTLRGHSMRSCCWRLIWSPSKEKTSASCPSGSGSTPTEHGRTASILTALSPGSSKRYFRIICFATCLHHFIYVYIYLILHFLLHVCWKRNIQICIY